MSQLPYAQQQDGTTFLGKIVGLLILLGIIIIPLDLIFFFMSTSAQNALLNVPGLGVFVKILAIIGQGYVVVASIGGLLFCLFNSGSLVLRITICLLIISAGIELFHVMTPHTSQQVTITQTDFTEHDLFINQGDVVRFVNSGSGTYQTLCVETAQRCEPNQAGLVELQGKGGTVRPGQTLQITFDTIGDYHIISTAQPQMGVFVHVRESPYLNFNSH